MDKEKAGDLIQQIKDELDYIENSSDDARDVLEELEEELKQ